MKKASKTSGWIALAVLLVATPAAAIAYDAQNAHRVDGKHAVGAGATKAARAGKLVATNSKGFLPNNIIKKAVNSAKLGGKPKGFFAPATHTHKGVPYEDVIIVAKSGGDFTSVQGALDSFTGSLNNPVLIWVAPGEYAGTFALEPYVSVQGAGKRLTTLRSDVGGATAVIEMAEGSTVSDVRIVNTDRPDEENVGVTTGGGSAELHDVSMRVEASGPSDPSAVGVEITGPEVQMLIKNASIEVSLGGGGAGTGVQIANASGDIRSSSINVISFGVGPAGGPMRGINNASGVVSVTDSDISTLYGSTAVGVLTGLTGVSAVSNLRDTNVQAGYGDSLSRALLLNGDSPQVHVRGSRLWTLAGAVIQSSVTGISYIRIANTELNGGDNQVGVTDSVRCLFSWDEDFAALDDDCDPVL